MENLENFVGTESTLQTNFQEGTPYFSYCSERPDPREIVALGPSDSPTIQKISEILAKEIKEFNLTVKIYDTQEQIWDLLKIQKEGICFGAFLDRADFQNKKFDLTMIFEDKDTDGRLDSNIPSQRNKAYNYDKKSLDFRSFMQYKVGGYTYLQNIFSNVILQSLTTEDASISMMVSPMKNQAIYDNFWVPLVSDQFAFISMMMFLPSVFSLTYYTVREKETKIRGLMKIMGLTDTTYWVSWFYYYQSANTILCLIVVGLCAYVFHIWTLVFLFLYIWIFSIWTFAF